MKGRDARRLGRCYVYSFTCCHYQSPPLPFSPFAGARVLRSCAPSAKPLGDAHSFQRFLSGWWIRCSARAMRRMSLPSAEVRRLGSDSAVRLSPSSASLALRWLPLGAHIYNARWSTCVIVLQRVRCSLPTLAHAVADASTVLRAQPAPVHGPILPLLSLTSREDLNQFVLGCDADLGELLVDLQVEFDEC